MGRFDHVKLSSTPLDGQCLLIEFSSRRDVTLLHRQERAVS